ncbi:hypothetical protein EAF04_006535 [Stromatinia cepivora]|nr:hypothetical protein EAF04_006535 [Stromatinia cepivora]
MKPSILTIASMQLDNRLSSLAIPLFKVLNGREMVLKSHVQRPTRNTFVWMLELWKPGTWKGGLDFQR